MIENKDFYQEILSFESQTDIRDKPASIKFVTSNKNCHLNIIQCGQPGQSYTLDEVRQIRDMLDDFLHESKIVKEYPFVIADWTLQKYEGEHFFNGTLLLNGEAIWVSQKVVVGDGIEIEDIAKQALKAVIEARYKVERSKLDKTIELINSLDSK